MSEIVSVRQKKVCVIISFVKLTSLIFCGFIIFDTFLEVVSYNNVDANGCLSMIPLEIVILGLILICLIWTLFMVRTLKLSNKMLSEVIEELIFILLFTVLIILSGAHESQYKLLFLFIIITSTLRSKMKHGIIVSVISSVIVLAIDRIYVIDTGINKYLQNDSILCIMFMLIAWLLGYYVRMQDEYDEKLSNLINEDGLTQVYNHRFFQQALKNIIEDTEKSKCSVSLILIDIDYFKIYNDVNGYEKGDEALRKISHILKGNMRAKDIVARYGGEEFVIILPNTDEKDSIDIAERIRAKVEKCKFEGEEKQPNGKITVSVGISTFPNKARNEMELINSADNALYSAKFFNKNRVENYNSVLEKLKKDIEEEHIDLITSIKILISIIDAKDRYTYGHVERVVMFAELLGNKLNLTNEEKKSLKYGAYLHDVGKINIPKEILNKRVHLNDEEWSIFKQHTISGVDLIRHIDSLKKIVPLILYHHEHYDGRGYPSQLKGDEIPYLSRILTIVDSFDAMTSNRSYNSRKNYDDAILEIRKCAGTQFDPYIAEKFIEVIKENKDSFDNLASLK